MSDKIKGDYGVEGQINGDGHADRAGFLKRLPQADSADVVSALDPRAIVLAWLVRFAKRIWRSCVAGRPSREIIRPRDRLLHGGLTA